MEASNTFTYTMEKTTFDKELAQTPYILGIIIANRAYENTHEQIEKGKSGS